jgi:TonB family protein
MPSSGIHTAENRKSRVVGIVATVFAHLAVAFVFLRITLNAAAVQSMTVELVMAPEEPKRVIKPVTVKPASTGKKTPTPASTKPPVLTKSAKIDDQGDVAVPEEKPKPVEIDKRSLFNSDETGAVEDNASGGHADSKDLFSGGSHASGAGAADGTSSFYLRGRSIVGTLEQPANTSNREGRVVVEIKVDQSGKVIQASAGKSGTTIQDAALWKAAEAAARQARFNPDANALPRQTGTITYVFKLK